MPDPARPTLDPADAPEPTRLGRPRAGRAPRPADGLAMSPVPPKPPAPTRAVLGLGGTIAPPRPPAPPNATLIPEDGLSWLDAQAEAAPAAAPPPAPEASAPVAAVVVAEDEPALGPTQVSRLSPEPALPAALPADPAPAGHLESDWFGTAGALAAEQRFAIPDDSDDPVVVRTRAPLWLLALAGGSLLTSGSLVATLGALFATGWLAVGRPAVLPPLELASQAAAAVPAAPEATIPAERPAPRAPKPRQASPLAGIGAEIDAPVDVGGPAAVEPAVEPAAPEPTGGTADPAPDEAPPDAALEAAGEPEVLQIEDVAGGPPPAVIEDIDVEPVAEPAAPIPSDGADAAPPPPTATIRPRPVPAGEAEQEPATEPEAAPVEPE